MLAKSINVITVLRSEAYTKVQNEFAKILRLKEIKEILPPTLKISPAVYIPHKSC